MTTPDPITTAHGWTDEVRQAVTALEDKYGIELISGPHHAKWVEAACYEIGGGAIRMYKDEVEKLKAELDEVHAEAKLIEESHTDDQRMIDRIADIIGLPQDRELDTFAFELWASEQNAEITRLTSQLEQAEKSKAPLNMWPGDNDVEDASPVQPVKLEWGERRKNNLFLNGKTIGCVSQCGDVWEYAFFETPSADDYPTEESARAALMSTARQWLSIGGK